MVDRAPRRADTELSFGAVGFGASVANTAVKYAHNFFSKKLLTSGGADDRGLSPEQLQFYTSLAMVVLLAPLVLYMTGLS